MFRPDEKAKQLAKELESHSFQEGGNEYEASRFGDYRLYAKNKRTKLQNSDAHLRSVVEDAPPIFRGLVMSVNGYTTPSLIDLHRLIVQHGGVFLQYMDKKSNITHMIASNLTLKKKVEFSRYKVVRPEWIVDSIAAGVLLPWRDYRLLDDVKNQSKLGYQSPGSPAIVKRNSLTEASSYKQSSTPAFENPRSRFGRDTVIPPSDEQEEWEDDFFPSYQRPPSSGKEASDARINRDVDDFGGEAPPSRHPSPPEGDEEEYMASPVGLVDVPSDIKSIVDGADDPESSNLRPNSPPPPAIVKGKPAYEPECIIGLRRHPKGARPKNRRGQMKYLIKWRGYSREEATWEFEKDLEEDLGKKELEEMVNDYTVLGEKKIPKLLKPETMSFTSNSTDGPVSSQHVDSGSQHSQLRPQVKMSVEIPEQSHSSIVSPRRSWKLDRGGGNDDDDDDDDDTQKDPSFVKETFIAPLSQVSSLLMSSSPPLGGQRAINEDMSSFEDNDTTIEQDLEPSVDPIIEEEENEEEDSPREPNILEDRLPSPLLVKKEELSPIARPPKRMLEHEEGESPLRKRIIPDEKNMTAEEFNAALLSDPNVRASSVLDPGFLEKYFNNSRLHHLSNWKAELKAEMQALATAKSSQRKPAVKARQRRYVLHIDFDCFFAAVSTRDRPDLREVPVAITHANSVNSTSSEIASCNYAARVFGLKNGMWMKQAKEFCPNLVCLNYDFEKYEEASKAFYEVIISMGGERVQAVSVDEVLLDASNLVCDIGLPGVEEEEAKALEIAQIIRNRCRERTRCEVSVGIGRNMLLAKLAMRKAKPAGMYIVREEEMDEFLEGIRVRDLPGFGRNITKKVEEQFNAVTVRLVKGISRERLKAELGEKTGEKLWRYCRGIDDTLVGEDVSERKTISVDVNYGVRFVTQEQVDKFVMEVAGLLQRRMEKEGVKAKKLYLQVKKRAAGAPMMTTKHLGHGPCDTVNKSASLGVATSEKETMGMETVTMLRSFRISPGELRGIGLSATNLETAKTHSSQTKLQFSKRPIEERNDSHVFHPPPLPPFAPPPPPPPAQKPRLVPYVKPRPTTLLDSFARMGARKDQPQKPKPPPQPSIVQRPKTPSPPHSPPMSQFLIPSQVDPEVLEEIRQSIREEAARQKRAQDEAEAKLLRQFDDVQDEERRGEEEAGKNVGEDSELDLLPNSQVDADVWKEMSREDRALYLQMQEEDRLLQQQQRPPPPPPPAQSPRKNRHLPWSKKGPPTPTKRREPIFPPANPAPPPPPPAEAQILDPQGIDVSPWLFTTGQVNKPLFLTLDAESQQDVIREARRHHTAHLALLAARARESAALQQRIANAYILPALPRQRYLGPGRIPVGNIGEIRSMLEGWFAEKRSEAPERRDVRLVAEFLKRLVVVELNISKAAAAVRIFRRVVEEGLDGVGNAAGGQGGVEEVDGGWRGVVDEFVDAVQEGVRERGLGPLDL